MSNDKRFYCELYSIDGVFLGFIGNTKSGLCQSASSRTYSKTNVRAHWLQLSGLPDTANIKIKEIKRRNSASA